MFKSYLRSILRIATVLLVSPSFNMGCVAHGVETPVATKYNLVIDESFSQEEREVVAQSGDSWATTIGPDLTISYTIASRVDIDSALEHSGPTTTIYAIRIGTMSDIGECLVPLQNFGCARGQRFYLAGDTLTATFYWKKAAMHEIGHVFGLGHSTNPSVMQEDLVDMAEKPTADDIYNWCRLHPCPIRLHK